MTRPSKKMRMNRFPDYYFFGKFSFEELKKTRNLQSEFVKQCTETNRMSVAIGKGNLDNVKWIWKQNPNWDNYKNVKVFFTLAACKGHFEVLQWLHEMKCPEGSVKIGPSNELRTNAFSMAAKVGSLEMMKWLQLRGYEWDKHTFAGACYHGNLKNMKWLKKNGCPWNKVAGYAMVRRGSFENILWARDAGYQFDGDFYTFGADLGDIKFMKWLKNTGCPMNAECFEMAARKGNMEMMKWLKANDCPWNKNVAQAAIEREHQLLNWLKASNMM